MLRDMEIGDSGNVEIEMGRPLLFLRLLSSLRQNPYLMLEHYLLLWMRQRLIIVR